MCAAGYSDYHDAAANFMWRAGPSGARAAPCVAAACPYNMLGSLAPPTAGAAGLRTLLLAGVDDNEVPATQSVKLAARAWARPLGHPLWLALVPGADHYDVAGLADTSVPAAAGRWAAVAAALRAFVAEDDGALAPACCETVEEAQRRCAGAPAYPCARRTLDALDVAEPFEAAMERGLLRWLEWTGQPVPAKLAGRLGAAREEH